MNDGEFIDGTIDMTVSAFTGNIFDGVYDMSMTMIVTMLQVSPTATAPDITDLDDKDYLFRLVPSDAYQGLVLGFRYSRLYVPTLSSFEEISSISLSSLSSSITTSPESPFPEKSPLESDVCIVR